MAEVELPEQIWTYSFCLWPSKHLRSAWPQVVIGQLRRHLLREDRDFTVAEWNTFRDEVERSGWELHEVERWASVVPGTVVL